MRIKPGREGGWLPCICDTGNAIFVAVSLVSNKLGRMVGRMAGRMVGRIERQREGAYFGDIETENIGGGNPVPMMPTYSL